MIIIQDLVSGCGLHCSQGTHLVIAVIDRSLARHAIGLMSKKKYTLFRAEGDGPKPCAFFGSEQGCRKGDACPFVHGAVTAPAAAADSLPTSDGRKKKRSPDDAQEPAVPATAKKQKSEPEPLVTETAPPLSSPSVETVREKVSSGKRDSASAQKKFDLAEFQQQQKLKHMRKRKSAQGMNATSKASPVVVPSISFALPSTFAVASTPAAAAVCPPSQRSLDDDDDETEDTKFLFNAVDIAIQGTRESSVLAPLRHVTQPVSFPPVPVTSVSAPAGRPPVVSSGQESLFLPTSAVPHILQTSGSAQAVFGIEKKRRSESFSTTQSEPLRHPPASSGPVTYDELLRLVGTTSSHPRFAAEYSFNTDETWVRSRPYGEWSKNLPLVIAIDCEMCVTEDPVTLAKNPHSLIRFSVVKGLEQGDVSRSMI